ncbi:uncharacterized protein HaLaN_13284, partial [Haematococcus lacustris]
MSIVPHHRFAESASQLHDEHDEESQSYLDAFLPPPGFSVWELPSNKLQTTAVALTFTATAGLITFTAAAGMLAILFTGAM